MNGIVVGVTAGRRAETLAGALRRAGLGVVVGSTVGGDEPAPDEQLASATDRILAADPAWLVASTGMGMGLWLDAAERTGRLEALGKLAHRVRCVARGTKAVAGLRRLGVEPEWIPEGQTDAEVVERLLTEMVEGQTVAVQLHGSATVHPYGALEDRGSVVTVTPYRSVLPDDPAPARALIARTLAGDVTMLTFTSPSAVRGLFELADDDDASADRLRAAMSDGSVTVASIGHVTSATLRHFGVAPHVEPERPRTGALVSEIAAWANG